MSVILHILPILQQAAPDGTADVAVYVSTSQPLTGLDWSFAPSTGSGQAPGIAQLLSRDLAGSAFPDPVGDLTGDLGGSVANVAQAVGPGELLVAHFKFRVEGVATTITPRQFPGTTGWVGSAPDFAEFPFDGFGSATISFPEPIALGFVVGLLLAFLWRRPCSK